MKWSEKEAALEKFYTKDHRFDVDGTQLYPPDPFHRWKLTLSLVYWLPFTVVAIYATLSSYLVMSYISLSVCLLVAFNRLYDGLDILQAQM